MAIAATDKPAVLSTEAPVDQKTDPTAKRLPGDDPGQNERADEPSQEDQPPPKKKKKLRFLFFLIGGVILLVILFFGPMF